MGLSVDSVYSHIAWVRNIEEKMGVQIPFPVIADLDMKVAKLYGMIHEGESTTETSRAVFIIDDKQVVRAMIYYPLSTGRNMDEILRAVKALQTTDANGVATPANWQPGDKVIIPPANTQEMAAERASNKEFEVKDWYFVMKSL
jgi:peroxiredoxin (alkyl hydroperoxide reductase subunit C)